MPLTLRPLHRESPHLAEVDSWYAAEEVQGWMDWGDLFNFTTVIANQLGAPYASGDPGASDTMAWIGLDDSGRPVAFIGGQLDESRTLGFTYAVAPDHRRKGYGRAIVQDLLSHPSSQDIEAFSCTVDHGNRASLALIDSIPEFIATRVQGEKGPVAFSYVRPVAGARGGRTHGAASG